MRRYAFSEVSKHCAVRFGSMKPGWYRSLLPARERQIPYSPGKIVSVRGGFSLVLQVGLCM